MSKKKKTKTFLCILNYFIDVCNVSHFFSREKGDKHTHIII